MTRPALVLTMGALIAVALAACGGEEPTQGTDRRDTDEFATALPRSEPSAASKRQPRGRRAQAEREPSITILEPTSREAVPAGAVTVSVSVKGFKVVAQRVRPPFPPPERGEGHIHFYLDTVALPTTHSAPATGSYRSISGRSYTWPDVGRGRHSFAVQLVGKDHAPLPAPVKDRITLLVE
jgi:hypothetical protein